ncbi:MAG: hypothetical protein WC730_01350 [Patescibacteria group bacterium]|jgi:hypothetical protein
MHEQHLRVWLPFLGIGLILGATVIVASWMMLAEGGKAQDSPIAQVETSEAPSPEVYEKQIHDMIGMVDVWSANEMYGILLSMRVPSDYREFHFALVQALEDLRDGKVEEGKSAIEALKVVYPWLANLP